MKTDESKRPCCQLLKRFANTPEKLREPEQVTQALDVIAQECIVLRILRQQHAAQATPSQLLQEKCYLHVNPEAATLLSEIGKTIAVYQSLQHHYQGLLAMLNGVLAQNANSQQIQAYLIPLLAELREGESKFGAVLAETKTLLSYDAQGNALENGIRGHPLLDTQQFDGISDIKANPKPSENPEAQENVAQLQLQPRPDLTYQPTPVARAAPTFKPS